MVRRIPGLDREAGSPWVYSIKMTRCPIGAPGKGRDDSPVDSSRVVSFPGRAPSILEPIRVRARRALQLGLSMNSDPTFSSRPDGACSFFVRYPGRRPLRGLALGLYPAHRWCAARSRCAEYPNYSAARSAALEWPRDLVGTCPERVEGPKAPLRGALHRLATRTAVQIHTNHR